jgi:hypothetical protein
MIILKDGRQIESETVWEQGGLVKARIYGAEVGYPKDSVARIEKAPRGSNDQKISEGFKFDVWHSGMSMSEVFNAAEEHDKPIIPSGVVSINKHFNLPLVAKYAGKVSEFYYQDSLMGRHAKVTLRFTRQSRLLSTVSVNYSATPGTNRLQLQHDLENLLREKYGRPFREADAVLSLQKSKYWRSGENGIIELRRYLSQDQIIYKDIRVVKQGEREDSNEAEFQRQTSFSRDKGKF